MARLSDEITAYLANGGLWNPEMANHDAVRDLLMRCRENIDALQRELAEARQEGVDWEYRHHHDAEHDCCVNCQLERIVERKKAVQAFAEKIVAILQKRIAAAEGAAVGANAIPMQNIAHNLKAALDEIRALLESTGGSHARQDG